MAGTTKTDCDNGDHGQVSDVWKTTANLIVDTNLVIENFFIASQREHLWKDYVHLCLQKIID